MEGLGNDLAGFFTLLPETRNINAACVIVLEQYSVLVEEVGVMG